MPSRGRPKSVAPMDGIRRKAIYNKKPRKMCVSCPPDKALKTTASFYKSGNPLHADGFLPMCKECIIKNSMDEEGRKVILDKFRLILQQIDRPFITTAYEASITEYENKYVACEDYNGGEEPIISIYFKNIQSLPQYRKMTWQDGIDAEKIKNAGTDVKQILPRPSKLVEIDHEEQIFLEDEDDDFEVTRSIINMFGQGYTKSEYHAMHDKYKFLSMSYPDVTNLHTEALCTYIRYKVKEEFATARGDVDSAEKWSSMATKAAEKAKINPNQLSQSDLQGGLNSFSELLMTVEQNCDIIPILPKFKYSPADAPDFIIWCYINYARKLEGKPLCDYNDIYHFYDERKKAYIAQYGDPYHIFDGDNTDKNKTSIEKFVDIRENAGGVHA